MVWKKRETFRIRAVQMNTLKAMSGVRRTGRMKTERTEQLVGVCKKDGVINKSTMRLYEHIKR